MKITVYHPEPGVTIRAFRPTFEITEEERKRRIGECYEACMQMIRHVEEREKAKKEVEQ